MVKAIEQKIARLLKKIEDLISSDEELARKVELLTSVKGIGKLTATYLIAYLPDINSFESAKQLAAYAGLSPKQEQSGTYCGLTRP